MGARLIDARRDTSWQGVAGRRLGSLFSSPPWIEAIARTYGFEISAATHGAEGGKLDAAILFSRVSDLRGDRIACLPFSDYCDPFVEDAAAWGELIRPVLDFAVPVTLRCLRNDIPAGDGRFMAVGRAAWHAVDLARPEHEVWAALAGSARQNVRKALRGGVVVREASGREDVRVFHRMHAHVRKSKYRLLAQPLAFFENLHELFAPDNRMTLLLAEVDGSPVAGIFFLVWGDTLYYKFNASVDQRLCPNDLMVWEGIRLGQRLGCTRLDFGISDFDQPGLIRYKRKFATEERPVSFLRWRPPGHADPRGEEAARTLGRMTRLLTDPAVPDDITRAAGDELYRFFC